MDISNLKLIFIYNADSGIINSVKDFFHKILSPDTYECKLCAVSYGNLGMKNEWKLYIKNLGIPTEFLHKDVFMKRYKVKDPDFPSAYIINDSKIKIFISQEEMNSLMSLGHLENVVGEKLEDFQKVLTS